MTSTRSAPLLLRISLVSLPFLAGCSGEAPETSAEEAGADVEEGEAPDPAEALERLRGLVSPAEFERFEKDRGLALGGSGATPGLTLVMPLNSTSIHLVDEAGEIQHTWETDFAPGGWAYLMEDGTLYRSGRADEDQSFRGGGIGGMIERIAPDGEVLWRYRMADEDRCQHHDIEVLENGNVLMIAWERKSAEEAIAKGRDPRGVGSQGLWSGAIYEVKPVGKDGGEIVWSWHAWDHLVQDLDPDKPDHAALADRPGRIDVNVAFVPPSEISDEEREAQERRRKQMAALGYGGGDDEEDEEEKDDDKPRAKDWDRSGDGMHTNAIDHGPAFDPFVPPSALSDEERKKQMAALGYGGGDDEEDEEEKDDDKPRAKDWDRSGDWMHTNAIDHHPVLDLIVLSSPELGELLVIDHSTTAEESRGSTGGRRGRGGDVLWRWGNPANHGAGTEADKRLFYQHDPRWIAVDAEGAAPRLTVFNNGGRRQDGSSFSEVLELELAMDGEGGFARGESGAFGPAEPSWSYSDGETFFSAFISGAARLASGNTLVCSGVIGRIFEVTPDGEIVWDYYSPLGGDVEPPEHAGKAPPFSLYRADRYDRDHPGVVALGLR